MNAHLKIPSDRIEAAQPSPAPARALHHPAERIEATAQPTVARRRLLVLSLNVITVAVLLAAMTGVLASGGFLMVEWLMLAAYAVTLPWLSIGLWNSVIGFALDRRHGASAAGFVLPALTRITGDEPIHTRIAIVMPLRNEDPVTSLDRFAGVQQALAETPWADRFEYHVLSDSDRPDIIAREQIGLDTWAASSPGATIRYRLRTDNTGFKAGNIAEFLDRRAEDYDLFIALDADSVMGAETILRMVRVMQASPEIGILQSLVTGLPSKTFFTRAFQFGMRHGMRSYTLGSAWWQADCGPNWGHNQIIRTAPFKAHCMLPVLPGTGPLSGDILSHDQLEAALMRKAGYEVRVMAEESESYEENPPSIADFIRRELRWCNGNMQYFRLLGMAGLKPVSRMQLLLAIQMYLAAPAWMLFIVLGAFVQTRPDQLSDLPVWSGIALFGVIMTLSLMPKLMGLGQILADPARARAYGGRDRVIWGGVTEILFSMLTAPIVAVALSIFLIGLAFGKRVGWDAQQRTRERLHWPEAARVLWPQTLLGVSLAAWLVATAPWALAFGAPILLALCFSIPIAVISTNPKLGALSITCGLFALPEDNKTAVNLSSQDLGAKQAAHEVSC
ncbi:glucans biosynthesis glucosyltransferase MdoH [Roseobacter sinensis]|uniref:Glucans biosynthesis glucosyltransferase H n=1 Tax=Roseobacter sinensis TaxID=2931391 RepID=A0ABT3BFG3_9RHOB|nr:glucans biosynthesis glucosyltransferase MdoH [Roseobacter sp. WL0113]MCV3272321.1 glucans biosynthesis glucosyltransferase MdoH [Roseobacter sp. WL0113]